MDILSKFAIMLGAIGGLVLLVAMLLFLAGRMRGRSESRNVGWLFIAPAVLGLLVAVIYPALKTITQSFQTSSTGSFVGVANYITVFTDPDQLVVLANTAAWVILSPLVASVIGLLYATFVDRSRFEALAKTFVFLPMAISFVGASIIWKFVYDYRPNIAGVGQTGLLNQIVVWFGGTPQEWLLYPPLNTIFLIVIMIWIQAGFAMTVLSAAIKGIPADIVEAARMDGASGFRLFMDVTFPSIRPTFIVVVTTIALWTLKVFDIVRTVTGGQFDTNVLANDFYTQVFQIGNTNVGATLAVLLFILVMPIVIYNVRQLRKAEAQ